MNIKFRLKIYLTSFLQIAQIKFVNDEQPVILKQGILEHASWYLCFSLLNLKAFSQWNAKYTALNAACQT